MVIIGHWDLGFDLAFGIGHWDLIKYYYLLIFYRSSPIHLLQLRSGERTLAYYFG
jgi:hypothetical protein